MANEPLQDKELIRWKCGHQKGPTVSAKGISGRLFRPHCPFLEDSDEIQAVAFVPMWCFDEGGFDHDNYRRYGWARFNGEIAPLSCVEIYPNLAAELTAGEARGWIDWFFGFIELDPKRMPSAVAPTRLRLPEPVLPPSDYPAPYAPRPKPEPTADPMAWARWFAETILCGDSESAIDGVLDAQMRFGPEVRRVMIPACSRATNRLLRVALRDRLLLPKPTFLRHDWGGFYLDMRAAAALWPAMTLYCARQAMKAADAFASDEARSQHREIFGPLGEALVASVETGLLALAKAHPWAILRMGYDPAVVKLAMRRNDEEAISALGEAGRLLETGFAAGEQDAGTNETLPL